MGEAYEQMKADAATASYLAQYKLDQLEPQAQEHLERLVFADPPYNYRKRSTEIKELLRISGLPRSSLNTAIQNLQNTFVERYRREHTRLRGPITRNNP